MNKGPYKVISSRSAYKNPWIEVKEEKVIKPDGEEGIFGIIDYGTGVTIAAIDEDKNIILVKEYYYAIEEYAVQLPSGGVKDNQLPLESAKEELLEETGFTAEKWVDLGIINPLTMILKSPAHLYLALNIKKGQQSEKGIEVLKMPLEEAYQKVIESKINHGPSALAIVKAKNYFDNNRF